MLKRTHFQIKKTAPASAIIFDSGEKIAEIKDLYLLNVLLTPSANIVIGDQVPMPLFWWQYANHQHPERNTGANGILSITKQEANEIRFHCQSQNQSGSVLSEYQLILHYSSEIESYVYTISAKLRIPAGKKWLVTPNSAHGELEFCNLWPQDVFTNDITKRKLYQACYVQKKAKIEKIPHHHLETSDKQNIELEKGDKFLWASEKINPVVEINSDPKVSVGVCAYMWDAHFGYRITDCSNDAWLEGEKRFSASFKLYALDEKAVSRTIQEASSPSTTEIINTPIYISGLNTFNDTLFDFPEQFSNLWPWSFQTSHHNKNRISGKLDTKNGYSDHSSLCIENFETADSVWLATTIGPAYGEARFPAGIRLKLSAMVKVEKVIGYADIALRFFQPGHGNIFNISDYIVIPSDHLHGTHDWANIEVLTPPLFPAPERVHLLLRFTGTGTAWFDDVVLRREFSSI
ncbi:hypothetical protein JW964_06445 [candidate division KSB1 bacterium]|nr:hypothetical protein [candidate division KSB1 bacterium]